MRFKKLCVHFFFYLLLLISVFKFDAYCDDNSSTTYYWKNPVYTHIEKTKDIDYKILGDETQIIVYDYDSLKEEIHKCMSNRQNSFLIKYIGNTTNFGDELVELYTQIFYEDHYLMWHTSSYSFSYVNKIESVDLNIHATYLSTYEQEQYVESQTDKILDSIITQDMNDYERIKAVHDYIVNNVNYDITYKKYSAYNALYDKSVVCQGYATLFYKMIDKLGINVVVISGQANGGSHGWNMVKLGPNWYHVDVTWDDPISFYGNNILRYDYFLLADLQIQKDHIWDIELFPQSISQFDFEEYINNLGNYIEKVNFNNPPLEINVGEVISLNVLVSPYDAKYCELYYESSNPEILGVADKTSNQIIGLAKGLATVFVYSKDKIVGDSVQINVIDNETGQLRYFQRRVIDNNKKWTLEFNKAVKFENIDDSIYIIDSHAKKLNITPVLGHSNRIIILNPPQEGYSSGDYFLIVDESLQSLQQSIQLNKKTILPFTVN